MNRKKKYINKKVQNYSNPVEDLILCENISIHHTLVNVILIYLGVKRFKSGRKCLLNF